MIERQFQQLGIDKQTLVTILNENGVPASNDETFTTLVPKTGEIQTGGVGDISEYFTDSITYGAQNLPGFVKTIKKLPKLSFNGDDMQYMFYNCGNLVSIDLSSFNTSSVTNMHLMFSGCESLSNLDLSSFNTSNATNMTGMFSGCNSLTTLDLSNFDTSNVTDMSNMFSSNTATSKLESINLNSFNTSKVMNMSRMFFGCSSLSNIDLSNFDTSQVTNMSGMFGYSSNSKSLPFINLDLSSFNMEKVNNFNGALYPSLNLVNLNFGINLGKGYTQKSNNYYNYEIDLRFSTNLSHDSIMSVINNLYDLNLTYDTANGGTLYTQKLNLGTTNRAKLTTSEIAIATAKGWTVS